MTLWELEDLSATGEIPEDCVPVSEKAGLLKHWSWAHFFPE